jgi:glycine oxidase
MGMGTIPTEKLDVQITYEMMEEIIKTAVHRVPLLEKASVLKAWAGVRPTTLDDHPILGPVSSVDGLILNCGWGGTGIIQAPIAGQLVAEYVSNRTTSTMNIDLLGIGRFEDRIGEVSK